MAMHLNNNYVTSINANMNLSTSTIPSISTTLPMTTDDNRNGLIITAPQAISVLGGSCSNLKSLLNTESTCSLQNELAQKTKQIQLIQSAYWSLRADFDNAINVIKQFKDKTADESSSRDLKLSTISEEEDEELIKLRERNAYLEKEIENMKQNQKKETDEIENMKRKNKDVNRKNNGLEKDIAHLKRKIKKLERDNRKLERFNNLEENKQNIRNNILSELYLNSNRVKEFMKTIKKFGNEYEILKKRQSNLISAVGMEDNETIKIRMNDLYSDILNVQQSYNTLYDALDVIKTESQGKEFELMTKDKQYILLLEKEKFVQSSHLDEYVKKNQTLQLDLTDREMKLRQSQNEINFIKQKLNRLQSDYTNTYGQIQQNNMNNMNNMNNIHNIHNMNSNYSNFNNNYTANYNNYNNNNYAQ